MPKSDKECMKIGIQMAHGQVFHSQFIPASSKVHTVPMVFMVLALMTKEQLEEFEKNDYVALYEYYNKSLPRRVNGYPSFISCCGLTRDENNKVIDAYNSELERMKWLDEEDETEREARWATGPGCSSNGAGGGTPISEP